MGKSTSKRMFYPLEGMKEVSTFEQVDLILREDRLVIEELMRRVFGVEQVFSSNAPFTAEIVSDSTGGGFYNAKLKVVDSSEFDANATTGVLVDRGSGGPADDGVIEVLNLVEVNTEVHLLDAGVFVWGMTERDDEDNIRYVVREVFGRYTLNPC